MNRLQIIQGGILILILVIGYFTYDYLNKENFNNSNRIDSLEEKEIKFNKGNFITEGSNKIIDLSYKSIDDNGNIYEINSSSGSIDADNENILLLEKVYAKIFIYNYGTVFINSGYARYDKISLDTHFFEDVGLKYLNHNVASNDLFLEYSKKEVKISNNVKYFDESNYLIADEMKLDLITKISKIYMNNKEKKIKLLVKN